MTSNIEAQSSTIGLSKSQKKRLKRNAAKNRRAAEENAVIETLQNDSINPNDFLRADLVRLGFKVGQIDQALEEMWNLQLKYDERDAVLNYLQERKTPEQTSEAVIVDQQPSKSEADTVSTSATALEPKATTTEEEAKHVNDSTAAVEESVGELNVNNEALPLQKSQKEEVSRQKKKNKNSRQPTARPNAIGMKLEMVANNDNLLDAMLALSEWVITAATPVEIKAFCTLSSSRALFIIIRRSMSPQENENIVGQLLDLIGSLLRIVGIPSNVLTKSAKVLASAAVQARVAIQADKTLNESISNSFAEKVVSVISKTVEIFTSSSRDVASTILSLEAEIENMPQPVSTDDGNRDVRQLMSNRDYHKVATEKYSKIVKFAVDGGLGNDIGKVNNDSNSDHIIACFLGDQYKEISCSKLRRETLQKRLFEATSSVERDTILSNVNVFVAEREKISSRMEKIKLELQQLTVQESSLQQKINQEKEKLFSFENSLNGETDEIETLLTEASKSMKTHENVLSIVQKLEKLDSVLFHSSTTILNSTEKVPAVSDVISKLPKNMEQYLLRTQNYFESEVRMINFLNERATSLELKLPSLEIEIQECTALGMTSNVSQMARNLKAITQDISDDKVIIDAMRLEASKMRNDLTERSEEYLRISREDETNLFDTSVHVNVLEAIRLSTRQIDLPEDLCFNDLIGSFGGKSLMVEDSNGYNNFYVEDREVVLNENVFCGEREIPAHVILDVPPSTKNKNNAVSNSATVPVVGGKKLGWGTVIPSKAPTKSLLDIQKEELSMK